MRTRPTPERNEGIYAAKNVLNTWSWAAENYADTMPGTEAETCLLLAALPPKYSHLLTALMTVKQCIANEALLLIAQISSLGPGHLAPPANEQTSRIIIL